MGIGNCPGGCDPVTLILRPIKGEGKSSRTRRKKVRWVALLSKKFCVIEHRRGTKQRAGGEKRTSDWRLQNTMPKPKKNVGGGEEKRKGRFKGRDG